MNRQTVNLSEQNTTTQECGSKTPKSPQNGMLKQQLPKDELPGVRYYIIYFLNS